MWAAIHIGAGSHYGALLAPHLATLNVVRPDHVADEANNPQRASGHEPHRRAAQTKIPSHATGKEEASEGDQRYPHPQGIAP